MSKAPQSQGGMGLPIKVGAVLLFAIGLFLFLPTVLLVTVLMLPTAVALVVDRSASRSGWLCVGGLNFAATAPFLFDLWFSAHTLETATQTISDVFTVMVVYGAAAFGWLIYMTMPQIIGTFMQMTSTRRIASLKAQQKRLVEEWGSEVAGDESE